MLVGRGSARDQSLCGAGSSSNSTEIEANIQHSPACLGSHRSYLLAASVSFYQDILQVFNL